MGHWILKDGKVKHTTCAFGSKWVERFKEYETSKLKRYNEQCNESDALKVQDAGMELNKKGVIKLVVYIHLMMQCISEVIQGMHNRLYINRPSYQFLLVVLF